MACYNKVHLHGSAVGLVCAPAVPVKVGVYNHDVEEVVGRFWLFRIGSQFCGGGSQGCAQEGSHDGDGFSYFCGGNGVYSTGAGTVTGVRVVPGDSCNRSFNDSVMLGLCDGHPYVPHIGKWWRLQRLRKVSRGKGGFPYPLQLQLKPHIVERGGDHVPVGPLLVKPVIEPDMDPVC